MFPTRAFGSGLVIVAAIACAGCGGPGDGGEDEGIWQRWTRLEFEASADVPIRASVQMHRETTDDTLLLETEARATLMGLELSRSRTRTTMVPETGRPREFVSLTRKRGRRYRFEPDGYVVERLEPTAGSDAPAEQWTVRSDRRFPNPSEREALFDYYGMILNMMRLPLSAPGDRATVWVATSSGPSQFEIVVDERRTRDRTLNDPALEQPVTLSLDELRLRITPLEDARDVRGFLGMSGETEIWVEARSKTLTEVRGSIRRVGQVVVELTGVRWR